MAAYAALVSLMNTIHDIINHPQISTFFDNKHTHTLLEKTSSLLDFIEADNYGKKAEDLERQITSAAQTAEEEIDLYVMDRIYGKTSETILKRKLNMWIKVRLSRITSAFSNSLRGSLDLQQKIQDMDAVMKKVNKFRGKRRLGGKQREPIAVMEIEETTMVGLDAELNMLLDELTRDPQSSRETISIVGMGGMGKTTLAKNIFENQLIKHHFDFRSWATISQQHNTQEILAQLISHSKKSSYKSVNELGEELHKNLFGRRYLIILDDIWSVNVWDEVRLFFPDNKNGSKIVLSTRLSSVAKDCGSSLFMMRFLDEDNSWKLFCEKVFKNETCPPELWKVGEEIVRLCRGLALSIVVMGGLLSKSPRTVEYWKSVVRDIKFISGGSLDVLSLSYNHLPAHLKPCFLYMGVFEEDSEIHVSEVVKLWIGEGFIKANGCGVLEEIGEGYIRDLIDRNLILVGRQQENGKIRCCGLHDLLRDLCIKLGEQQQFFSRDQTLNPTARRLIHQIPDFKKDRIPRARCILASFLTIQPIKQGLLRVLKTRSNVNSRANLYGNVNLRYLAYREDIGDFSLWELPTSVSLIWNLQTLIIQTYSNNAVVVAPAEIWKMRQLRHVESGNIYLPPYNQQVQDELLILKNLQTLRTVLNPRLCMKICKIIPNIIKLYLRYKPGWHGYDDCLIGYVCNLHRMHKLESLNLDIPYSMNKKPTFPNSLKELSLKGLSFNRDDLVKIGSLPQLEVLILSKLSVVGGRWSPTIGQFLRLKFLKLNLSSLKYWDADDSHFPVLEKLVLCSLPFLEDIPMGIGDIPTLELIHVRCCTVCATISAIKIKEDQLDNGNDRLQIQVSIWKYNRKEFEERVESEGLSTSNIQLETIYKE